VTWHLTSQGRMRSAVTNNALILKAASRRKKIVRVRLAGIMTTSRRVRVPGEVPMGLLPVVREAPRLGVSAQGGKEEPC